MTQFQKLKNEARRAEQRSNWQRAIELYREAIRLDERSGGSASDIALYNRVGDLFLRLGDSRAAVEYYEQAIDRYSSHDLKTSAIALCNKILRITPDHDDVYRRLGSLHASTGLTAEARTAFLEYVARKQRQDRLADALEAVQEYVDLTGDEEFRVPFSERLQEAGMVAEAVAQLRLVFSDRTSRGKDAESIRQRIVELDPEADPARVAEAEPPRPAAGESTRESRSTSGDMPASPPREPVTRVQLGQLVADALQADSHRVALDPEIRPRAGTASRPTSERDSTRSALAEMGFHELSALLARFRSQVQDIVADTDHAAHYDLGLAYMNMGLLGEAIDEFQHAMRSPAHMAAAHALIGQCLDPSKGLSGTTVSMAGTGAGGLPGLELLRPVAEIGTEPVPLQSEPEVSPDSADAPDAKRDPRSGVLFKARLAQYRVRQADSGNRTDHEAHLELGLAYLQMGLLTEARRDLTTALTGPRTVANRALDAMVTIGEDPQAEARERLAALQSLFRGGRTGDALRGAQALHRTLEHQDPIAGEALSLIKEIDPSAATGPTAAPDDPETAPATIAGTGAQPSEPGEVARRSRSSALDELEGILHEIVEGGTEASGTDARAVEGKTQARPAHDDTDLDADALLVDANASLQAGRPEEAVVDLYRALAQYERQRRIPKAAEVIEMLLRIDPDDVVLHHQRVEYAIMANHRAGLVDAYLGLACCLRRQAAYRAARNVYGRILDIDPENVDAGKGIEELDDEEVLRESQRRAVRPTAATEPAGQPPSQSGPGPAEDCGESTVTGVFDAMLSELQEDLPEDTDSADPASHYELAVAFRQMEMWEEAVRELQIAMRGLEDPLPAYELLGECLLALGRHGVARRVLVRALGSGAPDEKLMGILYFLAVACQDAGETESALEYFERVCAVDMQYRDAAARLSQLSR